ncbi:MAG: transaldolase [Betaproteobacteria bacterium]
MNPLLTAKRLGQSLWLDNLSRTLIEEGALERLIEEDGVSGVTSNPAIFLKAISQSPYYRDDIVRLKAQNIDAETLYEALVIPDIQAACDLLLKEYHRTQAEDGYVSLEVSPALAHDAKATLKAGLRLKAAVNRANLLIKVPATKAGIVAIESLIAAGCSVNVTLMFGLTHVREVALAYQKGLEQWVAQGGEPKAIKSVASLFLSRVDTLVDKKLESIGGSALTLCGKTGIALAKLAYSQYEEATQSKAFSALKAQGARPQTMLWASTGTKNPAYSDVMYVENLIGPNTINTLPDATLEAFRDHGQAHLRLNEDMPSCHTHWKKLQDLGIDMNAVAQSLQQDGLAQFEQAFSQLMIQLEGSLKG